MVICHIINIRASSYIDCINSAKVVIPITLFDFAAEVIGKSGPIVIDSDIDFIYDDYPENTAIVEDVIITGKSRAPGEATLPITLQDVREAFVELDIILTKHLANETYVPYTFSSIRFDEKKNKYVLTWND